VTVLALTVDWSWLLPILGLWILAAFVCAGLWGALVTAPERRERRAAARRPLAPVIELDLGRRRRAQVRRRNSA
jgi:hypothetical protein